MESHPAQNMKFSLLQMLGVLGNAAWFGFCVKSVVGEQGGIVPRGPTNKLAV